MIDFGNVQNVIEYFKTISEIPRCSKNEKQISDFLVNFANKRDYEVYQDELFNVIIKKPGTRGYENAPVVILQGHMDMVGEKTEKSTHDFSNDPINLIFDGDFISAKETTLGADNGIAIAYCMAILADDSISHPPLEILFTVQEENGLIGASKLLSHHLSGQILINMDAEEEGVLFTSCAGGIRCHLTLPIVREAKENMKAYQLKISNLRGGHSGMEIDKNRANANKLLGRTLDCIPNVAILNIEGGHKVNAITRESSAIIGIEDVFLTTIMRVCKELEQEFREDFKITDPAIVVELIDLDDEIKYVFDTSTTDKLLTLIKLHPYGVLSMSDDIEGLVESSANIGIISTGDNSIQVMSSIRSSVDSLKMRIVDHLENVSNTLEVDMATSASYPAWEYREKSAIRDLFVSTYVDVFDKTPVISAIHAGLECGVIGNQLGDLDMISFGPNIYDVHTPNEKISISSISNCWTYLLRTLEKMK